MQKRTGIRREKMNSGKEKMSYYWRVLNIVCLCWTARPFSVILFPLFFWCIFFIHNGAWFSLFISLSVFFLWIILMLNSNRILFLVCASARLWTSQSFNLSPSFPFSLLFTAFAAGACFLLSFFSFHKSLFFLLFFPNHFLYQYAENILK